MNTSYRNKDAFALILSIGLMGILSMLVLATSHLFRTELKENTIAQKTSIDQLNAKLGLKTAHAHLSSTKDASKPFIHSTDCLEVQASPLLIHHYDIFKAHKRNTLTNPKTHTPKIDISTTADRSLLKSYYNHHLSAKSDNVLMPSPRNEAANEHGISPIITDASFTVAVKFTESNTATSYQPKLILHNPYDVPLKEHEYKIIFHLPDADPDADPAYIELFWPTVHYSYSSGDDHIPLPLTRVCEYENVFYSATFTASFEAGEYKEISLHKSPEHLRRAKYAGKDLSIVCFERNYAEFSEFEEDFFCIDLIDMQTTKPFQKINKTINFERINHPDIYEPIGKELQYRGRILLEDYKTCSYSAHKHKDISGYENKSLIRRKIKDIDLSIDGILALKDAQLKDYQPVYELLDEYYTSEHRNIDSTPFLNFPLNINTATLKDWLRYTNGTPSPYRTAQELHQLTEAHKPFTSIAEFLKLTHTIIPTKITPCLTTVDDTFFISSESGKSHIQSILQRYPDQSIQVSHFRWLN